MAKLKSVLIVSLLSAAAGLLPIAGHGATTNISQINISQGNAAIQICGSGCVQILQQNNIAIVAVNQGGLDFAGSAYVSPGSFNFGDVVYARSHSFTLANTSSTQPLVVPPGAIGLSGADPGEFIETHSGCAIVLLPGQRCTITVTFRPSSLGPKSAVLALRDSAIDSPQRVELTGTGVAASISPASIEFGTVTVGAHSAPRTATIHNPGVDTLSVTGAGTSGANAAEFATSGCQSVPGGGSCALNVTFTPGDGGVRQAALAVTVNQLRQSTTLTVGLSGVGAPLALSSGALDFGSVLVRSHAGARDIMLRNLGSSPLSLRSSTLSGSQRDDFSAQPGCSGALPMTIPGGGSCPFHVDFTPAAAGPRAATLTFGYSSGGSDFSAAATLAGTGIAPGLAMSPAELDFGAVALGGSASRTFSLSNPGGAPNPVSSLSFSGHAGDFAITSSCAPPPLSLGPGQACPIEITFTPHAAGDRSSSLRIADSAAGASHILALKGSGVSAAAPPPAGGGQTPGGAISGSTSGPNAATTTSTGGSVLAASALGLPNTGVQAAAGGPCLVGFVSGKVGAVELLWLGGLLLILVLLVALRIRRLKRA